MHASHTETGQMSREHLLCITLTSPNRRFALDIDLVEETGSRECTVTTKCVLQTDQKELSHSYVLFTIILQNVESSFTLKSGDAPTESYS